MIERWFVSGFTLRRVTRTRNTAGAWTEANTDTATTGHIRPLSGQEMIEADQRSLRATHRFYCPFTLDIRAGDLLLYGGVSYRVVWPHNPGNQGRFWQVDLEQVSSDVR